MTAITSDQLNLLLFAIKMFDFQENGNIYRFHSRLHLSSARQSICVCVRVGMSHWWTNEKWLEINSQFFSTSYRHQKSYLTTYSTTLQLTTLTYFLKVIDLNLDHFVVVILQTVTYRAYITIANIQEISYWHSNDVLTFDHNTF